MQKGRLALKARKKTALQYDCSARNSNLSRRQRWRLYCVLPRPRRLSLEAKIYHRFAPCTASLHGSDRIGLASEAALHRCRPLPVHGVLARSRPFPPVATLHPFLTIPCLLNTCSTASTTSETVIRFIQRKSTGHSLKKQGLHST